jgi:hypothetical protein
MALQKKDCRAGWSTPSVNLHDLHLHRRLETVWNDVPLSDAMTKTRRALRTLQSWRLFAEQVEVRDGRYANLKECRSFANLVWESDKKQELKS